MHLLRVLRPINLAIIVFTMLGAAYFILSTNSYQFVRFHIIDFSLLIFSTILIAAAGNIINDYFDIKADRINKPDSLIIGKYIKKRWAILLHWIFNGVAVAISLYLSVKYESLWFIFIHVVSGNLLWFYSVYLKRKVFIGNFIVAILASCIPLIAVWYFRIANESKYIFSSFDSESWSTNLDYSFIYFISFCGFLQIFALEITKDIDDMIGDKVMKVITIPIKYGIQKAAWIAMILLQTPLIIGILLYITAKIEVTNLSLLFLMGAGLINLFIFIYYGFIKPLNFKTINMLIKISMFLPLLSFLFNYK
jgi:4-hydroxybenzoate polyprenyltransferase